MGTYFSGFCHVLVCLQNVPPGLVCSNTCSLPGVLLWKAVDLEGVCVWKPQKWESISTLFEGQSFSVLKVVNNRCGYTP